MLRVFDYGVPIKVRDKITVPLGSSFRDGDSSDLSSFRTRVVDTGVFLCLFSLYSTHVDSRFVTESEIPFIVNHST